MQRSLIVARRYSLSLGAAVGIALLCGCMELMSTRRGEPSSAIRDRVQRARRAQQERFRNTVVRCNAQMSPKLMDEFCVLGDSCKALLRLAISDLNLSARAYDRILRVARTLADLEGSPTLQPGNITEAIQYRTLDRQLW